MIIKSLDLSHSNKWFSACYKSCSHKVLPLDFIEGPIKEGMKTRWRKLEKFDIGELGYFEIPQGKVVGSGAVLTSRNELVHSAKLTFDKILPQKIKAFGVGALEENGDIMLMQGRDLTKSSFPLVNVMMPGMYIYGHWLIDILPKLFMLKRSINLNDYKIVFPNDLPKFAFAFLELLDIHQENLLFFDKAREILTSDLVVLPTKCRIRDGSWLAPFIGEMYDGIASQSSSYLAGREMKRLYVSRRKLKKQFRKLVNRDEISDRIISYGFDEIFPELYSFDEQIQMFKNADIIIGEFGSALHNSLFGPKDLKVISLQSNHIPLLVQWGICNIKEQACSLIFGEATEIRRSINSDFVIDEGQLDKVLASYCD